MANAREILDRMKSIQDTMKITNAMYMISSSKLKKAKASLDETEPYFYSMQMAIGRILRHVPDMKSEFFNQRPEIKPEDRKVGYIVVTADKGLAGSYNHNIFKDVEECLKNNSHAKLFVVGEMGRHYFEKKGLEIAHQFHYTAQNPSVSRARNITEKILADYNDVFADIMNGLLFAGEQRILPEALVNTSIHSQYKAEDEKVHELERDVAKYWKEKEVELAICGIENQSVVEKNMPFRVIGYDGTAYRSQLLEERKKILPVVTIVLYFGTDRHWNSKKNIKSLMEIPEGLDKFVNDYSMQVFEIAWLTEEEIERFQSDFRIVANFFVKKERTKIIYQMIRRK